MGTTSGCTLCPQLKSADQNILAINRNERIHWQNDRLFGSQPQYVSASSLLWGEDGGDKEPSIVVPSRPFFHYKLSDYDDLESPEDFEYGELETTEDESHGMTQLEDTKYFPIIRPNRTSRPKCLSQWQRNLAYLECPSRDLSVSSQCSPSPSQHLHPHCALILNTDAKSVGIRLESLPNVTNRQVKSSSSQPPVRSEERCRRSMIVVDTCLNPTAVSALPEEFTSSRSSGTRKCVMTANSKIDPQKFIDTFMPILKEKPACFDTLETLEFDAFHVVTLPKPFNAMPLLTTTVAVLYRLNTIERLKMSWHQVVNFLINIEDAYNDNAYHSNWHAADVVGTMAYFLSQGWFKTSLTPVHQITAILAAASHDVDHNAQNNQFHRLTKTPIGTLYTESNLEHHHVAISTVIRNLPGCDWTTELQNQDQEEVWKLFSSMILRTDCASHYGQKWEPFTTLAECTEEELNKSQEFALMEILHLSDISNPAKPRGIATKWAARFYKEFDDLGKEVRRLRLDIPIFKDPAKMPTLPDSQVFFLSKICLPSFEDLVTFMPEVQETVENLHRNLEYWNSEKDRMLQKKLSEKCHFDASHNDNSGSSLVRLVEVEMSDTDLQSSLFSLRSIEVS